MLEDSRSEEDHGGKGEEEQLSSKGIAKEKSGWSSGPWDHAIRTLIKLTKSNFALYLTLFLTPLTLTAATFSVCTVCDMA